MDDRELLRSVMEVVGKECCLDDCAVIPVKDRYLVASTDMLHRKTDFPDRMTGWQIGWTSVAVTLSDIAAMGARPCFVLLAIGLDENTAIFLSATTTSFCSLNGCNQETNMWARNPEGKFM